MNALQIAYFKHFLYDKDLVRSFLYFYRKNHINGSPSGDKDANPESVEEFFLQTTVEDVIMKAFLFYPTNEKRTNSSYEYWKGIDDQWQEYMKSNETNFSNDKWPLLKGSFSILRQNWDVDFFWRRYNFESTEEVYSRMRIDLPLPPSRWPHGEGSLVRDDEDKINYDIHNAQDGDIIVRVRKIKNGSIGRTTMIVKNVVPYDPDTSYLQPNQLHCEWDPERQNVYIAYLHAMYNSMGDDLRCKETVGREIHTVINDDSEVTKYRLAYEAEIDTLTQKLAEKGLAWNPDKKKLVPLSEAKELLDDDDRLKPKFKVGDRVHKIGVGYECTITNLEEDRYTTDMGYTILYKTQVFWELVQETNEPSVPIIEFNDGSEDDSMDEFEFVDVPKLNRSKRLYDDMVSVNIRNGGYRMTFNSHISKQLERNNFLMMRIARSKSGDICLIFSKNDGCPGRIGDNTYVVSSKTHIFKIRELLGITEDYDIIHIKPNSISTNYISYIIYK